MRFEYFIVSDVWWEGTRRGSIPFGYVWNSESTKERKKKTKKIDFLIFGFTVEKLIYNQIFSKIVCISKFFIPYIIEETNKRV